MEAGRVEEDRVRQGPVAGRLPAVDEDDARARRAAPGRDEPGRERTRRRTPTTASSVGQAESAGREHRRAPMREPGAQPIDEGEAQRGRERGEGQAGDRGRRVGRRARSKGTTRPHGLSSERR